MQARATTVQTGSSPVPHFFNFHRSTSLFNRSTNQIMKRIFLLGVATALCSPLLNAQVSIPAVTTGPVSVDAGPHHRTWQTVKVERNKQGQQFTTTNSYVELATGMNVWSETEGTWVAASDQIELVNGGAVAAKTQHKLTFLPNLNDREPPIDLFLPDGRPLRSQIVGL